MKIILLVFLFLTPIFADKLTFLDLNMLVSEKYNKTIIIDDSIKDKFMIYSKDLNGSITLNSIKSISKNLGYDYHNIGKFIYINRISNDKKKDTKVLDRLKNKSLLDRQKKQLKQFNKSIITTTIKKSLVMDMCKIMTYDCVFIGSGKYLVKSDIQDIDKSLFKAPKTKRYYLLTKLYQLDNNELEENNINLSALVDTSSSLVGGGLVNLLGNFGTEFQHNYKSNYNINAILSFLTSKNVGKLISEPTLNLSDGIPIVFKSGDSIPVVSDVITNTQSDLTTTTYKNVDVGIKIELLPTYLKNNSIDLDFKLSISSIVSNDPEKNILTTTKKSINGIYNIRLNKTLVLVRFNQSQDNIIRTSIPFLRDIPFLGYFFRYKHIEKSNKTILMTIKLIKDVSDTSINNQIIYHKKSIKLSSTQFLN